MVHENRRMHTVGRRILHPPCWAGVLQDSFHLRHRAAERKWVCLSVVSRSRARTSARAWDGTLPHDATVSGNMSVHMAG